MGFRWVLKLACCLWIVKMYRCTRFSRRTFVRISAMWWMNLKFMASYSSFMLNQTKQKVRNLLVFAFAYLFQYSVKLVLWVFEPIIKEFYNIRLIRFWIFNVREWKFESSGQYEFCPTNGIVFNIEINILLEFYLLIRMT